MKTACAFALACALIATFWPDHHRFDKGFVDHSVSREMVVAQFLKENLSSSTILYTNLNYPDFAYYSDLTVIAIPEGDEELYQSLESLPAGGILIAYKESDDGNHTPVEPALSFLDANPHFSRFREFPTMVLYWCR